MLPAGLKDPVLHVAHSFSEVSMNVDFELVAPVGSEAFAELQAGFDQVGTCCSWGPDLHLACCPGACGQPVEAARRGGELPRRGGMLHAQPCRWPRSSWPCASQAAGRSLAGGRLPAQGCQMGSARRACLVWGPRHPQDLPPPPPPPALPSWRAQLVLHVHQSRLLQVKATEIPLHLPEA